MRKYVDVIELIANEIFQETEADNMRPEMRLNIYRLKFMDFLIEQDNLLPSFNLSERKMMSRKIFNEVHKDFYE
jgi:DNA polymerase III delta prime subunit